MSARNLIASSGVTLVCTTDDPADSLEWHKQLAEEKDFPVKVLPGREGGPAILPQDAFYQLLGKTVFPASDKQVP